MKKLKTHKQRIIYLLSAIILTFSVYQIVLASTQGYWPNTTTPDDIVVANTAGNEGSQHLTRASDGNYIVTYLGGRSTLAQKFSSADGSAMAAWGGGFPVMAVFGSPSGIVPDASGGAYVATNIDFGGGSCGIYVQRLDSSGVAQFAPGGINVTVGGGGCEAFMQMISDGSGGFYLAWGIGGPNTSSFQTLDIFITRVNSSGTVDPSWNTLGAGTFRPVQFPETIARSRENSAKIVADGAGNVVAMYESDSTSAYFAATKFSPTGAIAGAPWNGPLNLDPDNNTPTGNNGNLGHSIIADGSGGVIIGYLIGPLGSVNGVETQRVNSAGALQWGNGVTVSTNDVDGGSWTPVIVGDGNGGVILAWNTKTVWDVWAHHVTSVGALDATGGWSGAPIALTDTTDGNSDWIVNAGGSDGEPDGAGGAYILTASYDGGPWPISKLQHLNSDGTLEFAGEGTPLAIGVGIEGIKSVMISDGSTGVVTAFQDTAPALDMDLYMQHFDDFTAGGSPAGGGGGGRSCTIYPPVLDLPPTLDVLYQNGKSVVKLDWGDVRTNDSSTSDKVQVFFNYLDQRVAPKLDSTDRSLVSIFTRHIYKQIYSSGNNSLVRAFEFQLRNFASGLNNLSFQQVQEAIVKDEVCDEDVSSVLMSTIKELVANPDTKDVTEGIVLKFIKELLSVERDLFRITSYKDSFVDYFNSHYRTAAETTYDDLTLKIYRDGKLIHTVENPAFTSYIDETVPKNTAKRVKTHNYYLVTQTECDSKTGDVGAAQIDPQLVPGTGIDVDADIKVKIKSGYDILFMEKLQALVQAARIKNKKNLGFSQNGGSVTNHTLSCSEASSNLAVADLNSNNIMNYILACHGSAELSPKLQAKKLKIIPPLLIALRLNSAEDTTTVIDKYIKSVIEELVEEMTNAEEVFGLVDGSMAKLDISQGISGFDKKDKEFIECAGIPACSREIKNKVTAYFKGSSHAAGLIVEVYDKTGNKVYQTDIKTDIFGEVNNVSLGQFLSGNEYMIKIRLANQRFVLPKHSVITLNTAEPKLGGGFKAHLNLAYSRQFRYGNFDESNDIIDINDILEWGKLISEQPELWNDSNLDGLYGIDLLDVITFQQNWGKVQESQIEEDQFTLMDLAKLFGFATSLETKIQVPDWLSLLESSCHN